ncbi:MAG TPA: M1 family metallopeptidase [Fimbriimonadaceae bacterium]|jgi:aminopeptidase N
MRSKWFILGPALTAILFVASTLDAKAQFNNGDAFSAPNATVHYAPNREYDLINVNVDVSVDWPDREFGGSVVDTLSPLRNGLDHITLDAGENLNIKSVEIDGQSTSFKHEGKKLIIASGMIPRDKVVRVKVTYDSKNAGGRGFGQGGEGGWHWIQTRVGEPNRIGFWTQGETGYNSNWVPIWDYPNDFTTSETHTTVPADWTVIGNGVPVSNTLSSDGKTRTFVWKMTIPHATYLLSLCGGPFDVGHDSWRGMPLWYVVPKGEGNLIKESFGHTQDMLSFYSDAIGYRFPWPKYAQDAMFDFGGGMENVSATTLGENSLTDERAGYYAMDSLNSHEMGHQWFGDTVTTKDWGQIWLNESFATYMQIMYFEHSRGPNGYAREIESALQSYLQEAQRYHRPVVTNFYSNPDAMFDQHTYPKGGVILHTLRQMLGDQAFFAGLKHYLLLHQHTPVETNDLCEAMTDSSGINLHPFFDQWLYKPGHPVLDTTWRWDGSNVVLHVKQTQDRSDGTPIYNVKTAIGIIDGTHLDEVPIRLTDKEQDFKVARSAKPNAVLFDPEHNFLREIPTLHWDKTELPYILQTAPNCIDRNKAMRDMLDGNPTDADINMIVSVLSADNSQFPAIESYFLLTNLKKESLRSFYETELKHPDIARRASGVEGLAALAATPEVTQQFRSYINDKEPYAIVRNSLQALADWDLKGNMDVFIKASQIPSLRNTVRTAALNILARSHTPEALNLIVGDTAPGHPTDFRTTALLALVTLTDSQPTAKAALRAALNDKDAAIEYAAVQAISRTDDKSFIPDLQALAARSDLPDAAQFKPYIENVIKQMS